jgi:putative PEP-CTERM system TPR-repeat lipoprotein
MMNHSRMNNVKHRSAVAFGLAATLALGLAGCSKSSTVSEAEHLARAKAFQAEGKIQSQVIELKNILQNSPDHAEAHFLLGEVYSGLGYGKDAERELLRAQDLGIDPEVIKAPLGKSLLDQKEYKRVLNEIKPSPRSTPQTIAAIKTLYAQAAIGQRQFDKGCGIFLEAKATDPTYVPAYWGVAQCSLGFGKPIEAGEELDAALKVDPKNFGTWLVRGDLWRSQNQFAEAEKAYSTGLDIRPNNLALLLARATVRVPLNNHQGVLEDLAAADKQEKDHPLALHLRGVLLSKDKKYADAKTSFERVLKTNPQYLPTILWLGITDYALNNLEQASHAFTQYVTEVPSADEVRAFLAITKARLGGKKAAADTLAVLDKADINDPQTLVMIGQAHLLTGDSEASSRYLTRAIEKEPQAVDPRANLVAALLQRGDKPGALKQAEDLFQKSPNDVRAAAILISALLENDQGDRALKIVDFIAPQLSKSPIPHIYRAAIKTKLNDLDGANADLERAQKIQPENVLVAHSLAAIAIQRNRYDEARRQYQKVLVKNTDQFETLMAMYDLEVLAKKPAAARKLVEAAAAKYPKAARSAAVIAAANIRDGNPDKALTLSEAAMGANPNDLDLLTARGTAYFNQGDWSNALAKFTRIARLRPDLAESHMKLALVHNAQNDFGALRTDLQQALRLDAKHVRARMMLATLNIRDKKFDEALKLARTVEQDFPTAPEPYILQSTALVSLKREVEAFAVLDRAQRAAPNSDVPVIEIAKLRFNAGQTDLGFAAIQTWLQTHPGNIRAMAFKAESLMAFKKDDKALAVYDDILKLEPENVIALNNVANLLLAKEPKRALAMAEKAYKRFPADTVITDTYGWILLKNGDTKRGLELLKEAYEAAPNTTEIHFHFAAALAQNGDKAYAKRELEKLLNNHKNFPERQEAQALFAGL